MKNDIFQMANTANAFFIAADRCGEMRLVNGNNQMLAAPSVVNRALSVEIYMKCLLEINKTKIPKSHLLIDIFESLPQDVKSDISKKMKCDISNLKNKISEMSNTFTDWRYIYEKSSCWADVDFLTNIALAMQHIVESYNLEVLSKNNN